MSKNLICISCPIGCHLTASFNPDGALEVTGNRCPRGVEYARAELTDPKRMVTQVVACESRIVPYLPVRTSEPISMKLIAPLLAELRRLRVVPPVKMEDVLIKDFQGSGVDIIASRSVEG